MLPARSFLSLPFLLPPLPFPLFPLSSLSPSPTSPVSPRSPPPFRPPAGIRDMEHRAQVTKPRAPTGTVKEQQTAIHGPHRCGSATCVYPSCFTLEISIILHSCSCLFQISCCVVPCLVHCLACHVLCLLPCLVLSFTLYRVASPVLCLVDTLELLGRERKRWDGGEQRRREGRRERGWGGWR